MKKLKWEPFHLFVNKAVFYPKFEKSVTYFIIISQCLVTNCCVNWERFFVTWPKWEGKYLLMMWKGEMRSSQSSNCFDPGSLKITESIVLWKRSQRNQRLSTIISCSHIKNIDFFFNLFRAIPAAYGGSQARNRIGAVAVSLHHSQTRQIQASSATYTTAHGNTWSLTHRARTGIEPTSS